MHKDIEMKLWFNIVCMSIVMSSSTSPMSLGRTFFTSKDDRITIADSDPVITYFPQLTQHALGLNATEAKRIMSVLINLTPHAQLIAEKKSSLAAIPGTINALVTKQFKNANNQTLISFIEKAAAYPESHALADAGCHLLVNKNLPTTWWHYAKKRLGFKTITPHELRTQALNLGLSTDTIKTHLNPQINLHKKGVMHQKSLGDLLISLNKMHEKKDLSFLHRWRHVLFQKMPDLLEKNISTRLNLNTDQVCVLFGKELTDFKGLELINFKNSQALKILIITTAQSDTVQTIPSGTFGAYPNLDELGILGFKGLTDIKDAFKGITHLKKLMIDNANLQKIDQSTFSTLHALTAITLSNCKLKKIHKDAFAHAPLLTSIGLSNNSLTRVDKGLFDHNKNLIYLRLDHNNLENIDLATFSPLKNNKKLIINLTGNASLDRERDLIPLKNMLTDAVIFTNNAIFSPHTNAESKK